MPYDFDIEKAVSDRYGDAAHSVETALCCPVQYDPKFLEILPDEIIERDYGCGDPSAFVKKGETVLDLGSGGGKICYITSQIVGETGTVIGVDTNLAMLALANKYRYRLAETIGYGNVRFHYGKIQDLALDLSLVDEYLKKHPINTAEDFAKYELFKKRMTGEHPLIASDSIDVILSNCVLNLVEPDDKDRMFREMFRVLKNGGRVAISDIVADEEIPHHLQNDPELWSGCISGAFQEDAFLAAFEKAGFYGMEIVKRDEKPWQTVEGIEFRAVTIVAYKGKQGKCLERNQAVIYKGPWKKVIDDDGHMLERGQRMAVCDKTFRVYTKEPYASQIIPVEPLESIPLEKAAEFDCARAVKRNPRETKGSEYNVTQVGETCDPDGNCC